MPILPNISIKIEIYDNAIRMKKTDNNTLKIEYTIYPISEPFLAHIEILEYRLANFYKMQANGIKLIVERLLDTKWDICTYQP